MTLHLTPRKGEREKWWLGVFLTGMPSKEGSARPWGSPGAKVIWERCSFPVSEHAALASLLPSVTTGSSAWGTASTHTSMDFRARQLRFLVTLPVVVVL